MFTGIVEVTGIVKSADVTPAGRRLVIAPQLAADAVSGGNREARQRSKLSNEWVPGSDPRLRLGDSVAVDGCCLTIADVEAGESREEPAMAFDAVHQTLSLTTLGSLRAGDHLHLERALTPSTPLGGHLVQGHVDALAEVVHVHRGGGEWRLRVRPPAELMDFLVLRGSVALAGVSLTVAAVDAQSFEVALIPATLERTTFARRQPGDQLNIEVDQIARIVVNWLSRRGPNAGM